MFEKRKTAGRRWPFIIPRILKISRMPSTRKCEICGKELDPRGLPGHRRFVHGEKKARAEGETLSEEEELPTVQLLDAASEVTQEGNAITLREEVQVTDPGSKKELMKVLKNRLQTENAAET